MDPDKYCRNLGVDIEDLMLWVSSCCVCDSIFEAFTVDTEFKPDLKFFRICKRWALDPSYQVRVLHRLEQMYFAKELRASIRRGRLPSKKMFFSIANNIEALMLGLKIELYSMVWRKLDWRLRRTYNVVISPLASIAVGHLQGHIWDVAITAGAKIGLDVTCSPGVRIVPSKKGAPTIGSKVQIFSGAVVIGNVTIGDFATVGALSLVIGDVPSGATVMGIRAKPIFSN